MDIVVILVTGILIGAICVWMMWALIAKQRGDITKNLESLRLEGQQRLQYVDKVKSIFSQMKPINALQEMLTEFKAVRESLKAERGRITITQAELETVENRLRELEEIERELAASGIETKEELNILKKKESELSEKNSFLKQKISGSRDEMSDTLSKIEMTAQNQAQVENMKREMLQTEEKIDTLILQIEQGNEQYFLLKQKYDALDIEYAQLFDKFSAEEEMRKKEQGLEE